MDILSNPLNDVEHSLSKKGGNNRMENEKNSVSEYKMDRFSKLMFGHRNHSQRPEEIEEIEEIEKTEDFQTSPINKHQRHDWILGHRRKEPKQQTENQIEKLLNGVDQQLLFETIDTAATFMNTMKPLVKEIRPHLNSILTRFKKK